MLVKVWAVAGMEDGQDSLTEAEIHETTATDLQGVKTKLVALYMTIKI